MPSPVLVVEVVSPGKANEDRDYRYKRSEYAARGILEYWIVDYAKRYPLGPQRDKVTILSLVDGLYGETVFENEQTIASKVIPQFSRTAADILRICENL